MARILLVEDNDILNKAYELILTKNGHTLATAYDGNEGLAVAKTFDPELILLDMLMPNMDGIGFLKAYDVTNTHPTVKIILLTNFSDPSLLAQALDLGAHEYYLKVRLAPDQLIAMVNKHVGESST